MPLPEGWESWPVDRLAAEVAEHNRRYWDDNEPLVSDYDYDRLVERLRAVAPDHPVLSAMGPSSENQPGDPVTHAVPMLSLDKAYDEETLQKWAAKFEGDLVMTPKVDGVACSIRYGADGRLQVAATRGSGTVGEDITANVLRIPDVPAAIPVDHPIEVRGEVYLPLSRFRDLAGQFANPRNTAAGALKQKDADRSAKMGLRFFCYDVVGDRADTELDKFALAASWGFSPVEHALVSRDEVQQGYEAYVARRAELDFEIDGVVFKANRLDEQARLGATSHHPRYAIAYKLQGDSATTVLREVEWSVSRTGALTPVGIVAPVSLSGATVTRISLHNWGLVQQKELTIGATVAAMRRGGVIPYLEAVVEPGEGAIEPPGSCPSCGTGVEIRGDFVVCPNVLGCPAQSVGILSHYAKITGIEGFGQVWLDTLVEHGALQSPVDYYRLTADALVRFERMGKTLAEKLVAQIDATRTLPLATFLQALGVPDLGKTASQTLARHFLSLERVRAAAPAELVDLPKFGELLAARVVDGIAKRGALIDALLEFVTVADAEPVAERAGLPWSGRSFLFTGTLLAMSREDAQEKVAALGGRAASGVSKGLDYLVVGNKGKAGSKLGKAEKLGVAVLSEDAFMEMMAAAEAEVASGE
ncbi:MAG: NAD-dependent DNA ligase LigA [bacterium]